MRDNDLPAPLAAYINRTLGEGSAPATSHPYTSATVALLGRAQDNALSYAVTLRDERDAGRTLTLATADTADVPAVVARLAAAHRSNPDAARALRALAARLSAGVPFPAEKPDGVTFALA